MDDILKKQEQAINAARNGYGRPNMPQRPGRPHRQSSTSWLKIFAIIIGVFCLIFLAIGLLLYNSSSSFSGKQPPAPDGYRELGKFESMPVVIIMKAAEIPQLKGVYINDDDKNPGEDLKALALFDFSEICPDLDEEYGLTGNNGKCVAEHMPALGESVHFLLEALKSMSIEELSTAAGTDVKPEVYKMLQNAQLDASNPEALVLVSQGTLDSGTFMKFWAEARIANGRLYTLMRLGDPRKPEEEAAALKKFINNL